MQFFKGLMSPKAGKPGVVEAAAAAAQVAAEPVRAAARGPDPELPSLTDEEAIQRGYQATRGLSPSEVAKFHAIYKGISGSARTEVTRAQVASIVLRFHQEVAPILELAAFKNAAVVAELLYEDADIKGRGMATFRDVLTTCAVRSKGSTRDRALHAFRAFDPNETGVATVASVEAAIRRAAGGMASVIRKIESKAGAPRDVGSQAASAMLRAIDTNPTLAHSLATIITHQASGGRSEFTQDDWAEWRQRQRPVLSTLQRVSKGDTLTAADAGSCAIM